MPHEVMAAVGGGIVPNSAPYLSHTAAVVVRLNAAIKTAALRFENLPKEMSHVVVRVVKGLKLADMWVLCRDFVVVIVGQLTHHRSAVIKGGLRALLDDLHTECGVCGQFMVPSTAVDSMPETHGWTACSRRWERGGCVSSCRPRRTRVCTPIYRKCNGPDDGGRPGPKPSRVGTSMCCLGPAHKRRCGP